MDRRTELDRIMRERGLTARDVGDILDREPHTVREWRCMSGRQIPALALALLKKELGIA
jgi:hypothetical protein